MRSIAFLLALTLAVVLFLSYRNRAPFDPALAGSFFPLSSGSTWTYRLIDEIQNTNEIFTDRAVGEERASPAKIGGALVSEYFGTGDGSNLRIFYKVENGYMTRIFDFGGRGEIQFRERAFLPRLLKPDLTWSNWTVPFGPFPEGFHLKQTHHTSLETAVVTVPAGKFSNCIRIETEVAFKGNLSQGVRARRLRYLDWYAPNVGLIRTLVFENGFFGAEIARVELLSFGDSPVKAVSH
jgi:hypothetical protein